MSKLDSASGREPGPLETADSTGTPEDLSVQGMYARGDIKAPPAYDPKEALVNIGGIHLNRRQLIFAALMGAGVVAGGALALAPRFLAKRDRAEVPQLQTLEEAYPNHTPEQRIQAAYLNNLQVSSRPMQDASEIVLESDGELSQEDIHRLLKHMFTNNDYFFSGDRGIDDLQGWARSGLRIKFGDRWLGRLCEMEDAARRPRTSPQPYIEKEGVKTIASSTAGRLISVDTSGENSIKVNLYNCVSGDKFKGGCPEEVMEFRQSEDGKWRLVSHKTDNMNLTGITMDTDFFESSTRSEWEKVYLPEGSIIERGAEWEAKWTDSSETKGGKKNEFGLLQNPDGTIKDYDWSDTSEASPSYGRL